MCAHDHARRAEPQAPDVDRLARSMLALRGAHDLDDHRPGGTTVRAPAHGARHRISPATRSARPPCTRPPSATGSGYLNSGLTPVACRFCHVTVDAKKLGPGHTAVQWNSAATEGCAYFAEIRADGGDSSPLPVLTEVRRQHQTRGRRGMPGSGIDGAVTGRRLAR